MWLTTSWRALLPAHCLRTGQVFTPATLYPCFRYIGKCLLSVYVSAHWTMYCLMRFLLSVIWHSCLIWSIWFCWLCRYSKTRGFLLWCFMQAQNCSNVRPGGRKSFCRLILSCSILSLLLYSLLSVGRSTHGMMLVSPHHSMVIGTAAWGFSPRY